MSFDSLLNTDIYLVTKGSSQNYLGEWTYTWTDSTSTTKCRLSPITIAQRIQMAGAYDDVNYFGFFASGTAVTFNSRVKYGSSYYEIRERQYESSNHHITCTLSEI